MRQHVRKGAQLLQPVGGTLRRVIPIVLAHHDKFDGSHQDKVDGSGYAPASPGGGENIPLEARIISVADVYDSLTSDRPYGRAMSPMEAKDIIVKGSGTDFDPQIVQAFVGVFRSGEMEIPAVFV